MTSSAATASFRTYLIHDRAQALVLALAQARPCRPSPLRFTPRSVVGPRHGLTVPRSLRCGRSNSCFCKRCGDSPSKCRSPLELFYYWEEMTVTEIADVLETPVGNRQESATACPRQARRGHRRTSPSPKTCSVSTMDNFEMWAREAAKAHGPNQAQREPSSPHSEVRAAWVRWGKQWRPEIRSIGAHDAVRGRLAPPVRKRLSAWSGGVRRSVDSMFDSAVLA